MLDSKFIITLTALIIAIVALCTRPIISEGFWNVSAPRAVKVVREVTYTNKNGKKIPVSVQNNYQSMLGNSGAFVSYPSFQGALSPRFGNIQMGANIRYNPPSIAHTAVPRDPLSFGDMANEKYTENFCSGGKCGGGCGSANCGGSATCDQSAPISSNSNYVNAMNSVYKDSLPVTDLVSVGDMTQVDASGSAVQSIIYDRYMFVNQKSRLRGLGDPIRGDLAIVPCNNGWFNPSASPNIDLRQGAMNVMGGNNNDTALALGQLQFITSGQSQQIVAGVPMSLSMNNNIQGSSSAAGGDITFSAFP